MGAGKQHLNGTSTLGSDQFPNLLDEVTLGDRMDFDPEIVVRLAWEGVPIVNIPTRVRYFRGGLSHFRMVRDNLLIIRTYVRLVGARVRRALG